MKYLLALLALASTPVSASTVDDLFIVLEEISFTYNPSEVAKLNTRLADILENVDLSEIRKSDTEFFFQKVFWMANYKEGHLYIKLMNKLLEAGHSTDGLLASDEETPLIVSAFKSCNKEVHNKFYGKIDDFSKPLIAKKKYGGLNSTKEIYILKEVYESYITCKSQEDRDYQNEFIKKIIFNNGNPLKTINGRAPLTRVLSGDLLEYYMSSGFADDSVIKEDPLPVLKSLIYSDANIKKLTTFLNRYEVDLVKVAQENPGLLNNISRNLRGIERAIAINKVFVLNGYPVSSDKSPLNSLLDRDIVFMIKDNKPLLDLYIDIVDFYFEFDKTLVNSVEFKDNVKYINNESLKVYILSKYEGQIGFKLWKKQLVNDFIEDGLAFNTVQKVIEENNHDINFVGEFRKTALHLAVERNDLQLVDYLLNRGAKSNVFDIEGNSPVTFASTSSMLSLLIRHGVDITLENQIGVLFTNTDEFDRMTFSRTLTNIKNGYNITHKVASLNNLEVLSFIEIRNKNLLTLKDRLGKTPAFYAAAFGAQEALNFISKHDDFKTVDNEGKNILFYALRSNNLEIVKLLVSKGVSPFEKDIEGNRVYDYVNSKAFKNLSIKDYINSLSSVSDRSIDLSLKLNTIFDKVSQKDYEAVMELMKADAGVLNLKDEFGRTPLFIAVENEDTRMVNLLLVNGASVNLKDEFEMTPLDYAIEFGLLEIERILKRYL